jgi:PKD repeat protein
MTIGSETKPVPKGGIPFTVKVVLEGSVSNLIGFQLSIKFNYPAINCTKTSYWLPYDDQNFIFYGVDKRLILNTSNIDLTEQYIAIMALITDLNKAVSKTGTLTLCMINFTGNKVGTYTLDFIAEYGYTLLTDNSGNEIPITSMQSLTVNILSAKSPPTAIFKISPTAAKANKTVTFDASGSFDPDGNITRYIWDFGDGSSNETSKSITTHIYVKNGQYNVTLTVVDNDNMTDSISQILMVGRPPIAIFTMNPSENLRPGVTLTLNASVSYDPDGNITRYIWDFGDGYNETIDTPITTHVYGKRGVYTITLKVIDNEGLINSTATSIQVGTPPVASFTFTPENPKVMEEVTFDASNSSGIEKPIVKFSWFFEDKQRNETTESLMITYIFVSAGNWTVTLTVYDGDGLFSSASKVVPVSYEAPKTAGIGTETIAAITVIVIIVAIAIVVKKKRSKQEEVIEI